MPKSTEGPADLFIRHNGVGIYHTYKDDEVEYGPRTYWFVTDPYLGENDAFDVRDLPSFAEPNHWIELTGAITRALRDAIDAGIVTADGVKEVAR